MCNEKAAIRSRLQEGDNVWKFDGDHIYLTFASANIPGREDDNSDLYYIDLVRLGTPGDILDWLAQLVEKSWVTDKILADFVHAVDTAVGLR